MKCFLTNLLLLIIISNTTAQPRIQEFVKKNQVAVASVSNDTSFAGYEAIAAAIGDKRVVMLGEQDHGDAPSFLAKTKIIKYLHEKKGFTVLAFESDFFSLTEGQAEIGNDTAFFRKYIQSNVFPIWPYCDACSELFYQYLPTTFLSPTPIMVTGFDNQLHGWFTRRKMHSYLDSVLSLLKTGMPQYESIRPQVLTWTDSIIKNYGKKFVTKENAETFEAAMKQVIAAWRQKNGDDYTTRLLTSILGFSNQSYYYYTKNWWEGGVIRDREMAANLNWLVNVKYKNEKIIVWAASGHILKNSASISSSKHTTMGTFFCDMPGNKEQTYILGFASANGKAGRITSKEFDVIAPRKNAFEKWFGEMPYAFIDFTAYRLTGPTEPFLMKGMGHRYDDEGPWADCFDGVFYIKDMYPCKPTY